jgi:hypothetical protein
MGFGAVLSAREIRAQLCELPLLPILRDVFLLVEIADHAAVGSDERPQRQQALAALLFRDDDLNLFEGLTKMFGAAAPLAASAASLLTLALQRLAVFDASDQDLGELDADWGQVGLLSDLILNVNQWIDDQNPQDANAGKQQLERYLEAMSAAHREMKRTAMSGNQRLTALGRRGPLFAIATSLHQLNKRVAERRRKMPPTRGRWEDPWVIAIERLRWDLFVQRAAPRYWYETAYGVFVERLVHEADCADALVRFEQGTGIDLIQYWKNGVLVGTTGDATWDLLAHADTEAVRSGTSGLPPDFARDPIGTWYRIYGYWLKDRNGVVFDTSEGGPPWRTQGYFDLVSRDLEDVVSAAKIDVANESPWAFTAFYARPIIRIGPTLGLISRMRFLEERAAPEGLFWPLIEEGGITHKNLSEAYGGALEQFGANVLEATRRPDETIWSQAALEARWPAKNEKVCDTFLWSSRLQLGAAFEFKQNFFTKKVRATGRSADAVDEMKKFIDKKVVEGLAFQISETLARIRLSSSDYAGPILPILVTGSSFRSSPELYDLVTAAMPNEALSGLSLASDILPRGYIIMDVFDLVAIAASAQHDERALLEILIMWQKSPLSDLSVMAWSATPDGPAFPWRGEAETWYHAASDGLEGVMPEPRKKRPHA